MAASEGRPLVEAVEHKEDFYEHQEPSGCGYGCFRGFGWSWCSRRGSEEGKGLVEQKGDSRLSYKLRKIKEFSEVIAGPKWKTFIRKISGYGRKQQQQKNRFQYDEHSYALNFNSGAQSEDDDMPPSFSARFSAPFPSTRRQTEQ
ncbi:hypothetical protein AAZX31_09G089200 [Glycine max]|uniref:Stress induced protein n=2 Tax=Glycine subgen. Soja TaxID=1462606 RepID=I1L2B4_SOYBN|nr:uncharacterized protein LOC102668365 [Glycine max]XP_028180148.1 uncharacterized protein LOC114367208 [Glycine soja]KAG4991049.1 hypothetical protein JHK87_024506 [Glycine soja]KAG5006597.1 hypothetical protein JHK85_025139 [Glycine max]KAG5133351.1 hypothetical protein JHK82_024539 [Glycine max]KAH1042280.1 hypothetical protein GYH30_024540 [Glycine max]KAH1232797.1 hypothetical protein GmHk_09G025372 [Glycine max]|eukprot:XP_014617525.2 uncharacterized protein LOC102668365 [Glycine max]